MRATNVNKTKYNLLRSLFILLPVLVVLIISFVNGASMFDLRPVWNDEFFYHAQVKGVLEYGKPLGYWGYNGTHAKVGTFGPWGAPTIMLMALFARLVPGNLNMLIMSNLLCACLANYAFLKFTKPGEKMLQRLILVYATLYVNHLYSLTAMAEIFRYAMAVLLAGLTYFLLRRKEHPRYSVVLLVVAPLMIFVAMSAYIPFAAVLPIWCYAVYRRYPALLKYKWVYAAACVVFTAMTAVVLFAVNEATAAPYTVNWVGNVLAHLREGIFTGLQFVLESSWDNFRECVLKYAFSPSSFAAEFGFISYYILAYLFAIVMAAWAVFRSCNKQTSSSHEGKEIPLIALYFLVAFVAAFVVLYASPGWTFVRGINVAFVYVLYLAAADSDVSSMNMIRRVALFSLIGIIPFICALNDDFLVDRAKSISEEELILQEKFAEHIQLSEENDPWGNTVSYYGYGGSILYLPDGVGVNYMRDSAAEQNARYCVLEKNYTSADFVAVLTEYGHCVLYENEDIILMLNEEY